ncbi:glycoside hydrolase family 26 protein [Streptomyces avermitilis]|uniref:glycoside hydrolase family 26 protein n=1 Tax=Streptomyces avermitilis TaxID=33903 RepID=UPI003827CB48
MAAQQRRRRRWPAYIAAGIAASAALMPGLGYAAGTREEAAADPPVPLPTATTATTATATTGTTATATAAPTATATTTTATATATTTVVPSAPSAVTSTSEPPAPPPAFGAYLDYGPSGVTRMAKLSRWLDGAELRVGHTYLPGDRWSNIEGAPRFLDAWANWRRERDDRILALNVPMLEGNEESHSYTEVRTLLRRGAAGEFDEHYRRLAERLVDLGVPDTVLVLGWEMNGITYTHRCGPDPEAWKTYWNRIVTTMRSVPGQKFRFDFTPSRGRDAVPWTDCYPGDDTVDIIGMDTYDQPQGMSFDEQVAEPYGLQKHVDFAKEHGKPISYPEWGLFRNGDNAVYMRRMLAWMDEHKPLYNTLTDYCPHGVWRCRQNPKAAEAYRSALSGRTESEPTSPVSAPGSAPAPVSTSDPASAPLPLQACSPLQLGTWTEYLLGGKLCVRFDWWSRTR